MPQPKLPQNQAVAQPQPQSQSQAVAQPQQQTVAQPPVGQQVTQPPEETCLPPELCVICSHGLKLGLCHQAANHLMSMKDMLISILNDLIDNIADLNPDEKAKLLQDRVQLKKQIEQLEKHLPTTFDEERVCCCSIEYYYMYLKDDWPRTQ